MSLWQLQKTGITMVGIRLGLTLEDTFLFMEVVMGVMVGGTTAGIMVSMMDSIMEDIMEENILQCM